MLKSQFHEQTGTGRTNYINEFLFWSRKGIYCPCNVYLEDQNCYFWLGIMFSTLKVISTGVSTVGVVKRLMDECSIHLFYKSSEGEIFELSWRLVSDEYNLFRLHSILSFRLFHEFFSFIVIKSSSSSDLLLYFKSTNWNRGHGSFII
jgi:hypothetical protein